jgi:DNA mismatch endonuclease, patch repair protein
LPSTKSNNISQRRTKVAKKVPRYSEFRPASQLASDIKKKNRSRDTRAELLLRRALWKQGLRYRLHDATLPGKPDIIFAKARVLIFCDGDFWHGRNWQSRKAKLVRGANAPYWVAKIKANMLRDRRRTRQLRRLGWTVLRFWETDILNNAEAVIIVTVDAVRGHNEGVRTSS